LGTSHAFPAQARDGAEYVNQLKVLAKRMNVRTGKLSQMLLPYGEETSTLEQAHASNVAQEKGAKFPTSKAPSSAVFHSFWLIFGRAIISRNGLEAWMLFPERARAEDSR
jgi:hypothetical protein